MAPPAKQRKTAHEAEKYFCTTCATNRLAKQFPDYNPTPDCEHLINTCWGCLKQWVKSQVEAGAPAVDPNNSDVFGISCPECDGIMRNVNIQIAATKKTYNRFEELERKHIAGTTPGWRWCLNPKCAAGQVHGQAEHGNTEPEDGSASSSPDLPLAKTSHRRQNSAVASASSQSRNDKSTKEEPDSKVDICTCNECGAMACVSCERPWHDGETCSQYQARIKDRLEEEDKTLRQIQLRTKPCPVCNKRIEKNGGCSMIFCTQCRTSFCWTCGEAPKNFMCGCIRGREVAPDS